MRILFVTHEFVTEKKVCGGLGHYIANISTILAEKGHKVIILLVTNHNHVFEWKQNIEVIAFKYYQAARKNKIGDYIEYFTKVDISTKLNRSFAVNEKIKEINRRNKIDIVQYCGDSNLFTWYRTRNIPCVVRMSSFGPWYAQASKIGSNMEDTSWLNTWDSKLQLYSFAKADAIFSPSVFVAQIINRKLNKCVRVIESPCMVNDEIKMPNIPAEIEGKKYLLYYGRICTLKGIDTIKKCIYDILERNAQLFFVFVGYEEIKNVMRSVKLAAKQYSDRVLYLGEIKDNEILFPIVKSSYACIFPSRADNLPNTCIEAMGLGKIVIGTYGASFEQLINHKESGLLIKRDSPKALIKAVDYLMLMTEEEREEMGERAKERVAQMTPDLVYERLILFYYEIINRVKRRKKGRGASDEWSGRLNYMKSH